MQVEEEGSCWFLEGQGQGRARWLVIKTSGARANVVRCAYQLTCCRSLVPALPGHGLTVVLTSWLRPVDVTNN